MVIQARRRFVVAFVLAVVLAYCAITASAQVLVPINCKGLTAADLAWWQRACWMYLASPDQPTFPGFVVR